MKISVIKKGSVALAGLLASGWVLASACDPVEGEKHFSGCKACHTADASANHMAGPNLWGIVGREAGKAPDYFYSPAFEKVDFTWTEQQLHAFLKNPSKRVPGNFMAFGGIKDKQQRQDLICHLKQLK